MKYQYTAQYADTSECEYDGTGSAIHETFRAPLIAVISLSAVYSHCACDSPRSLRHVIITAPGVSDLCITV
jgi:hypothetical protein